MEGDGVSMIFPIKELLDEKQCESWIETHFHPKGFACPHCGASQTEARYFRTSKRGLTDFRCRKCDKVYNLFSSTIFAGTRLKPSEVVLLLRGIYKGVPSATLAEELSLSRQTIHDWRHKIQKQAYFILETNELEDEETETDEMFQNAGEKSTPHLDPLDPPRCRANKKKGMGHMKTIDPQSLVP